MKTEIKKQNNLSEIEEIKESGDYLRGHIPEDLNDPITAGVSEHSKQLLKFHGMYLQDDRDIRNERRKQKLENYFNFMIRVRAPGGIVTPQQWLALDELARTYGNNTLRLTTRQSFQFHGIWKKNVKKVIREVNQHLLDTFAACGDVNRNVMCNPNPYQSEIHKDVYNWSLKLSDHLTPQTNAYHEIWLDKKLMVSNKSNQEPIYGKTYLPRKFKIAIAVPPSNDVDVFAHDLGFIAIVEENKLTGFNITAGGGMGMSHSEPETYPRLANVIGYCAPNQIIEVAEKVVLMQREYGDRKNRKHARLKYTIEDRGIEWFKKELHSRLGWKLKKAKKYKFDHNHDRYGWVKGINGQWHYTFFLQNGRIKDTKGVPVMTGLRKISRVHKGDFRLTPNQNLIIGNVSASKRPVIQDLINEYQLNSLEKYTGLRLNSMACVALPTCGLAMAESERFLPDLITRIEEIMKETGLSKDSIVIRMTGCPNGCARPYLGEIGFVGKAEGVYNIYLGASFSGERLNKLYRENVKDTKIIEELRPIIYHYSKERKKNESFGDFVIRKRYIKEVKAGREFHD